jgi:hypothetical protein
VWPVQVRWPFVPAEWFLQMGEAMEPLPEGLLGEGALQRLKAQATIPGLPHILFPSFSPSYSSPSSLPLLSSPSLSAFSILSVPFSFKSPHSPPILLPLLHALSLEHFPFITSTCPFNVPK